MSDPTRRVRQPGRTAQGHNKPDCGVCNNGAPGPIGLVVNGMGSPCCIEPFDNGGTAMPLTADAGNCSRSNSAVGPYWCSYTYPMSFGGSNFEWAVTIECVSDGMGGYHVHVGVSLLVFVGGGATDTIASGDWYSSSFPSCGDFDCTFPGGAPGGTLTFDTPGSWCTPGSCGTITWSLNVGNVDPCPQPAAKNCCCGGPVSWPGPCYHACLSGCSASAGELQLCFNKATERYETSNTSGVVGRLTNSGGSFTLEWSCNNFSTSGSHTFSGGEISFVGGSPVYSATVPDSSGCCADGTPVIIQLGRFTHCAGSCDTSCFLSALSADWDVIIGASLTNAVWNSCAAVGATFTVVQGGGIEPGALCNWGFVEALGDIDVGQTCGGCGPGGNCPMGSISASGLRISIGLYAVTGGCQFVLTLIFGSEADDTSGTGGKTSCKGTGTYYSDVYPLGSAAPTSVRFTGGGTATPACTGALPGTIDMFAA